MAENMVSEVERMVVTRVFDAHASWFGKRGPTEIRDAVVGAKGLAARLPDGCRVGGKSLSA